MKFENTPIAVQIINGVPMFELYSVGMALGYARNNGKSGSEHSVHPENRKLFPYKSRIDKVVKNAEIQPVVHGVQPYITESQLYDFMLEARTDKCRAFRKWLTNEVLPELNHKGSYTMPKQDKQLEFYNYFDKTYKGEPVLSIADIEHFTGLNRYLILKALKTGVEFMDYYYLRGDSLAKFKIDNPQISKLISGMYIITKSGFDTICKTYGIEIETPKLFIEEKKPDLSKHECVVFPSDAMKKLMGFIQNEVRAIEGMSHLMLTRDTKTNLNNYRNLLSLRLQKLRGYGLDVETIKI